jgi:hypothetical protein
MPWKVETTTRLVHVGQPDDSIAKIRLADGTELVVTDYFPNYPMWSMQLDPDFMPDKVALLIDQVYNEIFTGLSSDVTDGIERSSIVAQLDESLVKLGGQVKLTIQCGRWRNPHRSFNYTSPIVELIGSA